MCENEHLSPPQVHKRPLFARTVHPSAVDNTNGRGLDCPRHLGSDPDEITKLYKELVCHLEGVHGSPHDLSVVSSSEGELESPYQGLGFGEVKVAGLPLADPDQDEVRVQPSDPNCA
jgi:hypothetical protein